MNFRFTAVVFAAVTLLVAGLLVVGLFSAKDDEPARDGGLVTALTAAGIKEKDVDTLVLTRTGPGGPQTLAFVKRGSGWAMTEPARGAADPAAVGRVVSALFAARPVKHPDLTPNPALHGLDAPTLTATLKGPDNKAVTVNVGLTTIGGQKSAVTFVTTSDHPDRPLAVRRADLAVLFKDAAEFADGPAAESAKWLPEFFAGKVFGDLVDPESEVTGIGLTAGDSKLALARGPGGRWVFDEPKGFGDADLDGDPAGNPKAAPTGVRQLLNAVAGLRVRADSVADFVTAPGDPAKYGLTPGDSGVLRVEVRRRSAPAPEVVWLGKPVEGPGPPRVYARVEGEPTVFQVLADGVAALREAAARPTRLLTRKVFRDVTPTDVDSKVAGLTLAAGGKTLSVSRGDAGWTFDAPAGWGPAEADGDPAVTDLTAPFTGVRPILMALAGLKATSADDFVPDPTALAKYGLDESDPAAVRVELKPRTGPPEVAWVGKAVTDDKGAAVAPPAVYVRWGPAVAKVRTERAEALLRKTVADPAALRSRTLLPPVKRDKIDALDITTPDGTVKLRKVAAGGEAPRWVLYGGPADPQDAKATEVESLLTLLAQPRAAKAVLDKPDDAAFAPPRATVTVWVGGVEKPETAEPGKPAAEPKPTGDPFVVTVGKTDGDAVFVRRTGGGLPAQDFKLPAQAGAMAARSRLDYLDPKLETFGTEKAVGLKFNRGTEPVEVSKLPGGTGWQLLAPPNRKGMWADDDKVRGLLGLASALRVVRVAAEQPTPDQLKQWGLDPAAPRTRVTVRLQGEPMKEKDVVLDFGNDTPDGQAVYARQGGAGLVVTVPKDVFQRFAEGDLRSSVVYSLDPQGLSQVKLRGRFGGPAVQEFLFARRTAGVWTAVSPPTPEGFVPDGAKLEEISKLAAAPRGEKFVDVRVKPEYGLDLATNPEAVEITLIPAISAGATLVLGGKADGNKVYAMSSGVPGEVFTFDPAALKALIATPDGFKK